MRRYFSSFFIAISFYAFFAVCLFYLMANDKIFIKKAEETLTHEQSLYSLGHIVHNEQEMARLSRQGLHAINHDELAAMHGSKILFRAHGEPPSTYDLARENGIEIIDASCPVVLVLQKKIKKAYEKRYLLRWGPLPSFLCR